MERHFTGAGAYIAAEDLLAIVNIALAFSGITPEQIREKLPVAGILLKKDNDLKLINGKL